MAVVERDNGCGRAGLYGRRQRSWKERWEWTGAGRGRCSGRRDGLVVAVVVIIPLVLFIIIVLVQLGLHSS